MNLFQLIISKYYFLITSNYDENWLIGYPLLKKYQFVFNHDSRTIGFYNPDLPKEKESDDEGDEGGEDHNNKTNSDDTYNDDDINNQTDSDTIDEKDNDGSMNGKTIALIVFISGIVFIVIGLVIGKICFKKIKKKRANELDDNYDYNTYENETGRNIN